jgi:peptidoglycan/xylan/chitin deacetylase (PgdA/CDA1 family)
VKDKETVLQRQHLRQKTITLLHRSGLLQYAKESLARRGILVLTFHRIVPDHQLDLIRSPRGMVLRASLFAHLLEYLTEHTVCISARELDDAPAPTSKPRILLTFDDGWVDNAVVAWPMLKRARLPMCIFMATGLAGKSHPFWPERFLGIVRSAQRTDKLQQVHQQLCSLFRSSPSRVSPPPHLQEFEVEPELALPWIKQFSTADATSVIAAMESSYESAGSEPLDPAERLLDWSEAEQLASEGVSFGSHTVSHALLPRLSPVERRFELSRSQQDLERHLPCTGMIAYPNGDADENVAGDARTAGYRFGFRNMTGVWTRDTHRFLIPRVNVWDGKLTDSRHNFAPAALEYSLFWKSMRA